MLRKETIKKIINETIKYIKYDKKNERNELLKSVYEWIDFSDSGLLEAFEQMCHDYQVEIDRKLMNNQKLEMTKIVFKDNWETQKNLFEQYVILKNRINDCKEPEKLSELKREQKRLKDKLFNDNMWMVDYFLKHGFYPMIPKEDVKQIGYLILNENIDKFDYKEVNNDFYSNLSSCFFNKLDDMVLKFLYPDLTKNVIDFIKKLDDVAERLETRRYDLNKIYKNSLEPYTYHDKIVDLTEEMDTPRDRIKDFLLTKNRFEQIESLEDNFNAAEQLEYENNPIEYYIDASLLKEKIEELLQNLTPKEQKVIKLRFGLADGICYTPEKVSKLLKKSVDEVVRIERKALREIYESWIDYDKLYKTILEEGLLQTLTPLQQDVAKLRFGLVDGICYTKEEICKILNIKEHTVELVSSMVFVKIRDTERFRTFETIHRRF